MRPALRATARARSTITNVLMKNSVQSHADQVAAIHALIETAYFEGAFNALDMDAMARGFHPEFAILSADGAALARFTRADWLASIARRKSAPDFDPATVRRTGRIMQVDITGEVAAVKVEIDKEGALLYTDYLTLLHGPNGWRIVSKVYHEHAAAA